MARAGRSSSRTDAWVLVGCGVLALLATVLPPNLRDPAAGFFRRTVLAPLINIQAQAERVRSAVIERDITAARIDSLALRNSELTEFEHENERLRRLLGLAHELRWGFVPAQALHSQDRADQNSVIVTAGSDVGVVPHAPIVAPGGLVGVITTVDPGASQAILWTHPEFRASAMAADGSAFGIVTPHVGDDAERFLLELRGVPFRESLKPGTLIRSSGLGLVIPRGIPIGTVLGEAKGSEAWARTFLVRPTVKPSDVTNVMVLLPQRTTGDLTSVWPSAASVDSAVRLIVDAGDSLVAARRDSVRRDSLRRDALRRDTLVRRDTLRRDTLPGATPGRGGARR